MTSPRTRFGLRPLLPRDRAERHRVASSLELFFDLVFVIAVSLSSQALHHLEATGHLWAGVGAYAMVFFAIWWAWMNFTWFATAFDNDDWLYRVTTIAQMGGVLVLAAGTRPAMEHQDFALVTAGYVIMRLALVGQWLRVAHDSAGYRPTALRYVVGIATVQIAWVARLALPHELGLTSFLVLVVAELAVPVWAERRRPTPWHSHHIAERYGLFTLIVLGESLLASATAVVGALNGAQGGTGDVASLVLLAACGLVVVAGMWWVYFSVPFHEGFGTLRSSLTFGYAHYVVFAAAGAVSAGIEVQVGLHDGHAELTGAVAAATLTVPVAAFMAVVWLLAAPSRATGAAGTLIPVFVLGIGASALTPWPAVLAAAFVVAVVATLVVAPLRVAVLAEAAEGH